MAAPRKMMRAGGMADDGIMLHRRGEAPDGMYGGRAPSLDALGRDPPALADGGTSEHAVPSGMWPDVAYKLIPKRLRDDAQKDIEQDDHIFVWRTYYDIREMLGMRTTVYPLWHLNVLLRNAKLRANRRAEEAKLAALSGRPRRHEDEEEDAALDAIPLTIEQFAADVQYAGIVRTKHGSNNRIGSAGPEPEGLGVRLAHEQKSVNFWGEVTPGDRVGFRVCEIWVEHPDAGEPPFRCLQVLPCYERSNVFYQCSGEDGMPVDFRPDSLCGDADFIAHGHTETAMDYGVNDYGNPDLSRPIRASVMRFKHNAYTNGYFICVGLIYKPVPLRYLNVDELREALTTKEGMMRAREKNATVILHLTGNTAPQPLLPPPRA